MSGACFSFLSYPSTEWSLLRLSLSPLQDLQCLCYRGARGHVLLWISKNSLLEFKPHKILPLKLC